MADRNVRVVDDGGAKPFLLDLAKTASTAFDKNSLVEFASGLLSPSDDNDTQVLGIIKEEVAATDDDYASTTKKQVQIIRPGDIVEITSTASLTVGTSYGISNAYTVDATDTTNDVFTPVRIISSTKAQGFFKCLTGDGVS